MSKSDRDILFSLSVVIGMILLAILAGKISSNINPAWAAVLVFAYQQMYIIPQFISKYAKLHKVEATKSEKYALFYNELSIMSNPARKFQLTVLGTCLFCIIVNVLPLLSITFISDIITALFGLTKNRTVSFYLWIFAGLSYIAFCVSRGIEYLAIRNDIYEENNRLLERRYIGVSGTLIGLLFFVPLLRIFAFQNPNTLLDKLTIYNDAAAIEASLKANFKEGGNIGHRN